MINNNGKNYNINLGNDNNANIEIKNFKKQHDNSKKPENVKNKQNC